MIILLFIVLLYILGVVVHIDEKDGKYSTDWFWPITLFRKHVLKK